MNVLSIIAGMVFRPVLPRQPDIRASDAIYEAAMAISGEVLESLRGHSEVLESIRDYTQAPAAIREMIFDIWVRKRNVPYMVTVFEAVQEMNAAVGADDRVSRETLQRMAGASRVRSAR